MAKPTYICLNGLTEVICEQLSDNGKQKFICQLHVDCIAANTIAFTTFAELVSKTWAEPMPVLDNPILLQATCCHICKKQAQWFCIACLHAVCADHIVKQNNETARNCCCQTNAAVWPNPFKYMFVSLCSYVLQDSGSKGSYTFCKGLLTIKILTQKLSLQLTCWQYANDTFPTVLSILNTTSQVKISAWRISILPTEVTTVATPSRCHMFWSGNPVAIARKIKGLATSPGFQLAVAPYSLFMFLVSFQGPRCFATCFSCKRRQALELFAHSCCCVLPYSLLILATLEERRTIWQHMQALFLTA